MSTVSDIGQLISSDSNVRQGKPCIAGTGVSVQRIIGWYKQGKSPEEIADQYGHLSLAQIHAALAYYHANFDAMESAMQAEEVEEEQLYEQHRNHQK